MTLHLHKMTINDHENPRAGGPGPAEPDKQTSARAPATVRSVSLAAKI